MWLHKLRKNEKAVSNVIVVVLCLILIVVIVANVILWSYQMNQYDWKRNQEKIEITEITILPVTNNVQLKIRNKGSVPAQIVALWIINSTVHHRLTLNLIINPFEEITYTVPFSIKLNEKYLFKTITARGNIGVVSAKFAPSDSAMIVYGEGSIAIPRYRVWSGASWNVEQNAATTSSTIEWIVLKSCPVRNEKILGVLSSQGYLDVSVWNGEEKAWSSSLRIASVGTSIDAYRLFDIAYEQNSGRGIIVYNPSSSGSNPQFRIWNGTAWIWTDEIEKSASTNGMQCFDLSSDAYYENILS